MLYPPPPPHFCLVVLIIFVQVNMVDVHGAPVCSDTPNSGDWIFCEESGTSNLEIETDGVNIQTTDNAAIGVRGRHKGTGVNAITVLNSKIMTAGALTDGVYARHEGNGKIEVNLRSTSIVTKGRNAQGVFGDRLKSGDIEIDVRDTTIATESIAVNSRGRTTAHGIWGWMRDGTGNIDIKVQGGSIKTAGVDSNTILALHQGNGNIGIDVRGGTFETAGQVSHSVVGQHRGDGNVEINMRGATVITAGLQAYGILGWQLGRQQKNGDVRIDVRDTAVTTKSIAVGTNGSTLAHGIFGVVSGASNTGSLTIKAQGGSIKTSGISSHGIYGSHQGSGDLDITIGEDQSVSTTGSNAHGIRVYHSGSASARRIAVRTSGKVDARGAGSSGVRVGSVSAEGAVVGAAALNSVGLRQQTVIVNGRVYGGSGEDASGIFLAGGGRVAIGSRGSVGAASGIAILATGDVPPPNPNPDNLQPVKPRLRVDLNLANRRLAEVVGDNWIINDGGGTTIYMNGVKLHDADTGITGLSAPKGARNIRIRAEGVKVTDRTTDGSRMITDPVAGIVADRDFSARDIIEEYAPRAAVYEALPGFLLRLDAEIQDERIAWTDSQAWVRVAGGKGSYTPDRASVGAQFDFKRYSVETGFDIPLSENAEGSISVRTVQGSADVTASTGGGKIDAKGFGVASGIAVTLPGAWYARGRFSLTDYALDTKSSALGRLKTNIGALSRFVELEIGKRIELSEKMKLTPFARVTHSNLGIDAFTDSVNARVSLGDGSRLTSGLGIVAETVRTVRNGKLSLRGSLGVEQTVNGTRTSVEVSRESLSSRSDRMRPILSLGGLYLWDRFSLEAALSASGPGTDDTQYTGKAKFGIKF